MELRVNLNGKNRKDLVAAIAELTGEQAVYMKVPTCAYKIGAFTVGKFGSMTIEDGANDSKAELVIERLAERGFEVESFQMVEASPEQAAPETPQQSQEAQEPEPEQQENKLMVEIPADTMDEPLLIWTASLKQKGTCSARLSAPTAFPTRSKTNASAFLGLH